MATTPITNSANRKRLLVRMAFTGAREANVQAQPPPLGTRSGFNSRVENLPNRPTAQRDGGSLEISTHLVIPASAALVRDAPSSARKRIWHEVGGFGGKESRMPRISVGIEIWLRS